MRTCECVCQDRGQRCGGDGSVCRPVTTVLGRQVVDDGVVVMALWSLVLKGTFYLSVVGGLGSPGCRGRLWRIDVQDAMAGYGADLRATVDMVLDLFGPAVCLQAESLIQFV